MSDISKIKINDTTYNIKDPGARTIADNAVNIANNANTNADNRVSKSGDDMTGLLKMVDHNIALNKPNVDINTTIDNSQYCNIGATDKNATLFGYTQYIYYNDGSSAAQLAARGKATGATSTFDNSLVLKCYKDGTRGVSFSDSSIWLSALGFTDSGWKALNTSHNCYYRKFGPIVTVIISTSTTFATGNHDMGTLPSGYRPKYTIFTMTYSNYSRLSINSDNGYVVLISQGNTGTPTRCCCSFLVA